MTLYLFSVNYLILSMLFTLNNLLTVNYNTPGPGIQYDCVEIYIYIPITVIKYILNLQTTAVIQYILNLLK